MIAWEKVCCPKSEGGIGLINMKVWNRAAVAKLCCNLANKEDKLWIKWIHTYYIKGQREWQRRKHASWMIQKVMNAKKIVEQVQQMQRKIKGVIVEKTRVLWKSADENAEHLFMQCNFARRMWGRLLSWIEQQSNVPMTCEQFLQWCIQEDPVYLAIGIKACGVLIKSHELDVESDVYASSRGPNIPCHRYQGMIA